VFDTEEADEALECALGALRAHLADDEGLDASAFCGRRMAPLLPRSNSGRAYFVPPSLPRRPRCPLPTLVPPGFEPLRAPAAQHRSRSRTSNRDGSSAWMMAATGAALDDGISPAATAAELFGEHRFDGFGDWSNEYEDDDEDDEEESEPLCGALCGEADRICHMCNTHVCVACATREMTWQDMQQQQQQRRAGGSSFEGGALRGVAAVGSTPLLLPLLSSSCCALPAALPPPRALFRRCGNRACGRRVCEDCAADFLHSRCSVCGEARCADCINSGGDVEGLTPCGAACGAVACARCLATRLRAGAWRVCGVVASRECLAVVCCSGTCARESVACARCGAAACSDCLRRRPGCLLLYRGVDEDGDVAAALCRECWRGPRPGR
jgi:hypothetical protein